MANLKESGFVKPNTVDLQVDMRRQRLPNPGPGNLECPRGRRAAEMTWRDKRARQAGDVDGPS